ncbi:MAG: methyltransferase domain-containing protein [Deltaproteobacteria bacterium]|nr:methyltransferase domain-containing protein [Deltaproteobacteria bacterium]
MLQADELRRHYFRPELWERLEANKTPIYCRRDRADWFVPNRAGDRILQSLTTAPTTKKASLSAEESLFLQRLPAAPPQEYCPRPQNLKLTQLKELWLHLTNHCNQACKHCLFACSPASAGALDFATVQQISRQAYGLGVRIFALSGGEPTLHPDFSAIIDTLLAQTDTHVVVLTNGLRLKAMAPELARWPKQRFHLQVSLDGLEQEHDQMRGAGAFKTLAATLDWLKEQKIAVTLACCLTRNNYRSLNEIVDFAAANGVNNLHLTWYFVKGRGQAEAFTAMEELFPIITAAALRALEQGVSLDNLEALKSQIFAPPGTMHWAATSGWESLTLAPDHKIYPSPTLVSAPELGVPYNSDLASAWRDSPTLKKLRSSHPLMVDSPGNLLLGPGDPDQSYLTAKTFGGNDPYWPLQLKLALHLISEAAADSPVIGPPALRLQMGDILESCGAHGREALVHNNCLLALAAPDSRTVVKEFYREAARRPRLDILNPVTYDPELMRHIPEAFRWRGYGCGSPVSEAALQPGETLVDLGCGMGVECFIAARQVKENGRAIGIDMLEAMLSRARKALPAVSRNLGYNNLEFKFGYLEELPLEDESADIIISNCVLNLSANKRQVFREIFRVLKPGGRLLISDVVCMFEPDPAIRNDETLKGECIAGSLTLTHLFGLLQESGFINARSHKLFPYREVDGHLFHSLTFGAKKPAAPNHTTTECLVLPRGPFRALARSNDQGWLAAGRPALLPEAELSDYGDEIYRLDENGVVSNITFALSCDCGLAPELKSAHAPTATSAATIEPAKPAKQGLNCMVCGADLCYLTVEEEHPCHYCGQTLLSNALCENGHFVCDQCHLEDGLTVIEHLCRHRSETAMTSLLQEIRRHPAIPTHGPEHHALIPGIILAAYRNCGGPITESQIKAGIKRGAKLPGGACAFMGVCGAAMGVGTAFSVILEATPMQAQARRLSQTATHACLGKIIAYEAARCCQRESWLSLEEAARLSKEILPLPLELGPAPICQQFAKNPTCIKSECPLFPGVNRLKTL